MSFVGKESLHLVLNYIVLFNEGASIGTPEYRKKKKAVKTKSY